MTTTTEATLSSVVRAALRTVGFVADGETDRFASPEQPELRFALRTGRAGEVRLESAPFVPVLGGHGSIDTHSAVPAFFDAALAPDAPCSLIPDASHPNAVRLIAIHPGRRFDRHGVRRLTPDFDLAALSSEAQGVEPDVQAWVRAIVDAASDLFMGRSNSERASDCVDAIDTNSLDVDGLDTGSLDTGSLDAVIRRRGYETTRLGDTTRIALEHRHFRKNIVLRLEPTGLRLSVDLVETERWSPRSFAAAVRLVAATTRTLSPTRVVCRHLEERRSLVADFHLGPMSIDSAWLNLAVDGLDRAACALAETLPILADERIATLTESSRSAHRAVASSPSQP